jgi:hypothetical protein
MRTSYKYSFEPMIKRILIMNVFVFAILFFIRRDLVGALSVSALFTVLYFMWVSSDFVLMITLDTETPELVIKRRRYFSVRTYHIPINGLTYSFSEERQRYGSYDWVLRIFSNASETAKIVADQDGWSSEALRNLITQLEMVLKSM